MSLIIDSVSKRFGSVTALSDVSLRIQEGTLTTLLGPSGCGKTTLLRAIAGFEVLDSGRIHLGGRDVTDVPAGKRNVGFVFQHYALFPHLTVAENIAFPLRVRKASKGEVGSRVDELLALVQLEGYGGRRPHQLSGGQRQRIALARALAPKPGYLLLDEPFGALDLHVRRGLRRSLRELHERTRVTTLLVTHDADEALEISDNIAVLRAGRVLQTGDPQTIYNHPADAFVMRFLGEVNALAGTSSSVFVRPGDFRIENRPFAESLSAAVERRQDFGGRTQLHLTFADGQRATAELERAHASKLAIETGTTVYVEPTRFLAFNGASS
jgi:sulfate transport system ATP-binding protein